MKSSFGKGLFSVALSVGKVLLLALVVLAVGFGVVFPLWKWATVSPSSYTVVILLLLGLLVLYLLYKSFRRAGARVFFLRLFKAAILAGGIFLSLWLLFSLKRAASLVCLLVTLAAFVLVQAGARAK